MAGVGVGVPVRSNVWIARSLHSRVVAWVNAPVRTRATFGSPLASLLSTWSPCSHSTSLTRHIAPAATPNVSQAALDRYKYLPYLFVQIFVFSKRDYLRNHCVWKLYICSSCIIQYICALEGGDAMSWWVSHLSVRRSLSAALSNRHISKQRDDGLRTVSSVLFEEVSTIFCLHYSLFSPNIFPLQFTNNPYLYKNILIDNSPSVVRDQPRWCRSADAQPAIEPKFYKVESYVLNLTRNATLASSLAIRFQMKIELPL